MIQELLVMFACVNNSGCPETTSAYFNTHPEVRKQISHKERNVKKMVGPDIALAAPLIAAGVRGQGSVAISSYLSFKLTKDGTKLLVFQFTF